MAEHSSFSMHGRGYHICKEILMAVVDKELLCLGESDNPRDQFAVAVLKDSMTVGQI